MKKRGIWNNKKINKSKRRWERRELRRSEDREDVDRRKVKLIVGKESRAHEALTLHAFQISTQKHNY